MDHLDTNRNIRSAQPNKAPGPPFVGTFLGQEASSIGLMNIDDKIFLKTVGEELLGSNYDVKGHAGQKRSTSKNANTNKSASVTKKSAGTKTAAKKASKPRKNSASKKPKPSKPKKKSAGTKKTSKPRKNSADKKKPKPKTSSKGNAKPDLSSK